MTKSLYLLLSLVSFWGPAAFAMSKSAILQEQRVSVATVGVRTLSFTDESRKRPVVVEVWYPSGSEESGTDAMRDAPFAAADTSFPLILMSHGHGGHRLSQAWLALFLARQGYVVAAVEHYGHAYSSFNVLLSLRFWDRMRDVSYALDRLLEQFGSRINAGQIGFFGYSMGGMTGLGLAGAQAKNIREIALREYRKYKEFTEQAISSFDFSEGEKVYRDARIRAMLLVCPANFVYAPDTLKEIKIPVGLVANFHDEVLPHQEHAYPIITHLLPQKIKVIREKISHSFFCLTEGQDPKKEKLYNELATFSLDFFRLYLAK